MAAWTWVLGGIPPAGIERRELTTATGRVLTLRVDSPSTAQFSLDGRSTEAAEIVALGTDLHIYRDGIKLFRGRIGPESDSISESEHRCQFTATDYRGMLAYRIVGAAGATFLATDQGTIAYNLIATSQALVGGDWGVTNGLGAISGTVRDSVTYDPGKSLLDAISELGRNDNGFEWDIDPTFALRRWYPKRGTVTNVVLDYGGNVAKVERLLSPGDFANSVLGTGSSGLAPVTAISGISTDIRGLWEKFVGFSSVQDQPMLATKVVWLLSQTSHARPEISVTLTPGRWGGPSVLGLGDTATLAVFSGRLTIASAYRVAEILAVPGNDGTETIMLGLVPTTEQPTSVTAMVGSARVGTARVGYI